MTPVNLDQNATTPLLPAADEAMRQVNAQAPGNPASAHAAGRKARQFLETARERVASLLDCLPEEVLFTSGATEANNLAIFGLAGDVPGLIEASPIEHPCVTEPLKLLSKRGFTINWLPVDPRGFVDVVKFQRESKLRTVMLANHETGAIQPVKAMVTATPFHCDAAQAVGKISVSFRDLGVTTLSLSAHKFRGPKGVGALLVKQGTPLRPLMFGGHQQRSLRPGTEPVALAVGLATALEHAVSTMAATAVRLTAYRQRLIEQLRKAVPPVIVNGPLPGEANSLPTTLNVSFPGCRNDLLLMALDLAGVMCSTGSACSSGSLLPSQVLKEMHAPDDVLRSAMRFSVGETTTNAEMEDAAKRIAACVRKARE
ncbi:cysteine desulfurase NifS [soil metagenome]